MSNEYNEYMQMLADNAARVRRTSPKGTVKEISMADKGYIPSGPGQPYSNGEAYLAKATEGKADPGDISKMPQVYDGGIYERESRAAALHSWEIEKQMEPEKSSGVTQIRPMRVT